MNRGAEAELSATDGVVVKNRIAKGYRHEKIDERLREERTDQETRLLENAAQAGVNTPEVRETSPYRIEMERIDGDVLKDVFEERDDLWEAVGENIARLHDRDIIHGDLTTSNILVKDGELYFIDFGLGFYSQRVEDRATDLRLLEQVLQSTHFDVADEAFTAILEGYREEYDGSDEVIRQLDELKSRRRYS